jgi:hypothetical protein
MWLVRLWQAALLAAFGGGLVFLSAFFTGLAAPDRTVGAGLSADGQLLARSTGDGLAVFDIASGTARIRLDGWGGLAFSPDGSLLVCGGKDLTVWDLASGEPLHRWDGINRAWFRVAVTADGTMVAGLDDVSLRVWGLRTGVLLVTAPLAYEHASVAFTPDGKFVIAAGTEPKAGGERHHEIKFWAVPGGRLHTRLTGPEYCHVNALAVSPDGKSLATALSVQTLRVWDIATGKESWKAADVPMYEHAFAYSADGRWLLAAGGETVTLLDTTRPGTRKTLTIPGGRINMARAGATPGSFSLAAEGGVYVVDADAGRIALVGTGLTLRPLIARWAALAFAAWAALWVVGWTLARRGLDPDQAAAETRSCAVVFLTACCSAGHWGLLLAEAWGPRGPDPISTFAGLAALWVMGLCLLLTWGFRPWGRPASIVFAAFCVAAVLWQIGFDLYMLGEVIASV